MLLIVLIYFVMVFCSVYFSYSSITNSSVLYSPEMYQLIMDGSLVAIALGISGLYGELGNNALNTLIVKPVYRDSILNGKLLGALCFAVCLFVLGALFNISLYYMFVGSSCYNLLSTFVNQLSLVMVLFLLSFMVFYLLTLLAYLVLRDHCVSLFIGFSSWMFLNNILPDAAFISYVANICSALFNLNIISASSQVSSIAETISPGVICFSLISNSNSLSYAINNNWPLLLPLLLYGVALLILCYIVFMRRDVA
jgi:ABC-2 type transport system permease protein